MSSPTPSSQQRSLLAGQKSEKYFAKGFLSRPVSRSAQSTERYNWLVSQFCSRWGWYYNLRCSCHIKLNGLLRICRASSWNSSSHWMQPPRSLAPKKATHGREWRAKARNVSISSNLLHQTMHRFPSNPLVTFWCKRYEFCTACGRIPALLEAPSIYICLICKRVFFVKCVVLHFDAWSCAFSPQLASQLVLFCLGSACTCFRIMAF